MINDRTYLALKGEILTTHWAHMLCTRCRPLSGSFRLLTWQNTVEYHWHARLISVRTSSGESILDADLEPALRFLGRDRELPTVLSDTTERASSAAHERISQIYILETEFYDTSSQYVDVTKTNDDTNIAWGGQVARQAEAVCMHFLQLC